MIINKKIKLAVLSSMVITAVAPAAGALAETPVQVPDKGIYDFDKGLFYTIEEFKKLIRTDKASILNSDNNYLVLDNGKAISTRAILTSTNENMDDNIVDYTDVDVDWGSVDPIVDLAIGEVEVEIDFENDVATVTAAVTGAEEGTTATVTITPDAMYTDEVIAELALELGITTDILLSLLTQEVAVEDGMVVAEFSPLLPGTHTAKVAIGDVESSIEFTVEAEEAPGELVVESVMAITNLVDVKGKQALGFTVNDGSVATLDELKEVGYEIEFQATKAVFTDNKTTSKTGELLENLAAGEFEYQVVITKEDKTVTSATQKVTVQNFSNIGSEAKSYKLSVNGGNGTFESVSGKISLKDTSIQIEDVKFVTKAGTEKTFTATELNFKSSNNGVAIVTDEGIINPISTGTVTISVVTKNGDASQTIELTVVDEVRTATNVATTHAALKLVTDKTANVSLTVTDQLGDPFKGNVFVKSAKSGDDIIAYLVGGETVILDAKGKKEVSVLAGSKAGSASLLVQDKATEGKTLLTIPVTTSSDSTVATRELVLDDATKSTELDMNRLLEGKNSVVLVLNQFNKDGFLIGNETITNSSKYTVDASNTDIIELDPIGTDITVTGKKVGNASVQIKEGGIVRYHLPISVKNTQPELQSVTLETGLKITTSSLNANDILKAGNLTLTTPETGGRSIATETNSDGQVVYFIDANDNGKYDKAEDVTIGILKANSTFNASNVKFDVMGTLKGIEKDDKGSVVISFVKGDNPAASAITTTTIDVDASQILATKVSLVEVPKNGNLAIIGEVAKVVVNGADANRISTIDLAGAIVDELVIKDVANNVDGKGTVTIKNGEVKKLIIEESAQGIINIDSVDVTVELDLRGGGEESVNLKGTTSVAKATFNSSTPVKVSTSETATIKDAVVAVTPTTGKIQLDAKVTGTLTVNAVNTKIDVTREVARFVANSSVEVTGDGQITDAVVKADGVSLAKAPTNKYFEKAVEVAGTTVVATTTNAEKKLNEDTQVIIDNLVTKFVEDILGGKTVSKADGLAKLEAKQGKTAYDQLSALISKVTAKVGDAETKTLDITSYDTVNAGIKAELEKIAKDTEVTFTFTVGTGDNAITGTTTVEVTVPAQ